ncbi:ABC transporter permease [Roseospirillum parvum]|uniref:Putative spermidine/putrescine transport system permease protein n=1 Tax=Roseospirillum parvum TaxID=83401 RepID=A0A1G8D5E1_9PROT|nr:ABC transporter permease [Roseospirillum parvum]SDH52450.1 putative spermidine/putrescine transport system permease protein [Roseospirillum parvum]
MAEPIPVSANGAPGTPGATDTPDDDVSSLKARLRRAERRRRLTAMLLVAPLFAFLLVSFLIPMGDMLLRSVDNWQIPNVLPNTVERIAAWDGEALPEEAVYAAMAADIRAGKESGEIGKAATRLNYEVSGARSLFNKTRRRIERIEPPYKAALIDIDRRWGQPDIWQAIKRESGPYTASYYLAAADLTYNAEGEVVAVPEYRQVYVELFIRTIWMSLAITGLTILLGYPVAYLLANLPLRYSNLLMILVLLPFWTSLLVRTTTWITILQSQGVINDILVWLGLIATDERLQLIHNKIGTMVAMTHILLPFMILPLYSVMKTIPPSYMRAARSLGATPLTAFVKVYLPQTVSGVGAGSILVFILAIGYYITPALVGGETGQFISNFIARHMLVSLNWGLAAALGSMLLAGVLVLYLVYNKLVGIDNMKLG